MLYRILLIGVLTLGLWGCKENSNPPHSEKATNLNFEITRLMDTHVAFTVNPDDANCYYYYVLKSSAEIESLKYSGNELAQKALDSLYELYCEWSQEQPKEYCADFGSHSLYNGYNTQIHVLLHPDTEYQLLGFCVDPVRVKLLGDMQVFKFRTTPVDTEYVSPMTVDFAVDMNRGDKIMAIEVTARPTYQGRVCLDPYFFTVLPQSELDLSYGGSVERFIQESMDLLRELEVTRELVYVDVCNDEYPRVNEGTEMVAVAAPYTSTWQQSVFTRRFKMESGKKLPYAHDEE